jgi:hypothetical protein
VDVLSDAVSAAPDTLADGIVRTQWTPGPLDGTRNPVIVAVTDFLVSAADDFQEVIQTGLELEKSWPVMHGAVGLWLWAKPAELRQGSVSVWEHAEDLQGFVRWPVHLEIMRAWRERGALVADRWEAPAFVPDEAWTRVEARLRAPHPSA